MKTKKVADHQHTKIAQHSPSQQAMFFGLANQLGISIQEVKERAVKRFRLKCFNDLKSSQINWLIDKLLEKQQEIERQEECVCGQCIPCKKRGTAVKLKLIEENKRLKGGETQK